MNHHQEILNLITSPAFAVLDGAIAQCNDEAQRLHFSIGDKIGPMLPVDCKEYPGFQGECLFLSLTHNEIRYSCTVMQIDGTDVFILDPDEDQKELKTLSLTAANMRQPLSAMIATAGNLFPLIEQAQDPKVKEQVDHMNRSLCQMHRMLCNMSDALQYADGSSRHMVCQNIVEVVTGIFQRAQELSQHNGIELKYSVPNEPILCSVDEQLLERGIYNILSNALKFSEPGTVIQASLTRRDGTLYISVQDQGSGIPGQIMRTVFQRYMRQPSLEDSRFGLGLGLVLVRAAARIHGGTVLIDRPASVGTRTTISIPIRQSPQSMVRSNFALVDYAGGWDHGLLELSDVLPAHLYNTK